MMTVTQYASHRGVSRQAVQKAIADGRISASRSGKKFMIDPVAADAAWDRNTDPLTGGRPWMERADPPKFPERFVLETPVEVALVDLVEELLVTRVQIDDAGREFLAANLVLPLVVLAVHADTDPDPVRRRLRHVIAAAAGAHIDVDAIRAEDETPD